MQETFRIGNRSFRIVATGMEGIPIPELISATTEEFRAYIRWATAEMKRRRDARVKAQETHEALAQQREKIASRVKADNAVQSWQMRRAEGQR